MTETKTNIEEAMDSETFDVLDFVAGVANPQDSVDIFTDRDAGYQLSLLLAQEEVTDEQIESDGLSIADEVPYADPDIVDALVERVKASTLVFHLRGLGNVRRKEVRDELVKKYEYDMDNPKDSDDAYFEEFSAALIAESIVKVVAPDGRVNESPWTAEMVTKLRDQILDSEYARLDRRTYTLTYSSDLFDRAVNADFLSRR